MANTRMIVAIEAMLVTALTSLLAFAIAAELNMPLLIVVIILAIIVAGTRIGEWLARVKGTAGPRQRG